MILGQIVGLRNENSTNQVVADAGSSYNSWMTGGTHEVKMVPIIYKPPWYKSSLFIWIGILTAVAVGGGGLFWWWPCARHQPMVGVLGAQLRSWGNGESVDR